MEYDDDDDDDEEEEEEEEEEEDGSKEERQQPTLIFPHPGLLLSPPICTFGQQASHNTEFKEKERPEIDS